MVTMLSCDKKQFQLLLLLLYLFGRKKLCGKQEIEGWENKAIEL